MTSQQSQVLKATATAELKVTTTPILTAIPPGKKQDDLAVLVRVEAPEHKVVKRVPIDLVVVLDVSSSMTWLPDKENQVPGKGEKSRLDHLKAAMEFLINKLHEQDRLAIVTFNAKVIESTKLELISGNGRASALGLVKNLETGSGTVFKPALLEAVNKLQQRDIKSSSKRVGFILFLSDGFEIFEETSDPRNRVRWAEPTLSLKKELGSYPIHTFGFSRFHDPTALQGIAAASDGGTYSFIGQDLDKITDAFAVCLDGFSSVVAVNATISLTAMHPVAIVGIDSGGYDDSSCEEGSASRTIRIPILSTGNANNFIVRLRVPASTSEGDQPLLAAEGSWFDATDGAKVPIAKQRLSVKRSATEAGRCRPNVNVLKQVARLKLLSLLQELPNHLNDAKWLSTSWNEYKKKEINLHGELMGSLDKDVEEMEAQLEKGKKGDSKLGEAYAWSYMSSHQRERSTTMGSPEKVVEDYKTPTVTTVLENARRKTRDIVNGHGMVFEEARQDAQDINGHGMVFEEARYDAQDINGHGAIFENAREGQDTNVHGPTKAAPPPVPEGSPDMAAHKSSPSQLKDNGPCKCTQAQQDRLKKQQAIWSKFNLGLFQNYQHHATSHQAELSAVYEEASLEAINLAKHHIYLAVVQASLNLNGRYCCDGKAPVHHDHDTSGGHDHGEI